MDPEEESMKSMTFTVVVSTNDERDNAEERLALQFAAMLHLKFGEYELRGPSGRWLYDPLAHDGNHDGHNRTMTLEPTRRGARG